MKKKILFIMPSLILGGIETFVFNLFKSLDKNEFEVHFALMSYLVHDYYLDDVLSMGAKVFKTDKDKYKNKLTRMKKYYEFIYSLAKENKYDVVHIHSSTTLLYRAAKACRKAGCKCIIYHSHSTSGMTGKLISPFLRKKVIKYSDYQFSCGEKASEWMYGKSFKNLKNHKIINNGFITSKYKYNEDIRKEFRNTLKLSENDLAFVTVSSLTNVKNHLFLIDVFKKAKQEKNNIKLFIIGDGYLKEDIKNKIDEYNLSNDVFMLGNKNNVYEFLQAMDVFLMPSIYEGLPTSAIEAQCSGLPSILSKNIDSNVDVNKLVTFKDINNIDEWVNALISAKRNDNRLASYKLIKDKGYDINDIAIEISNIYKGITK